MSKINTFSRVLNKKVKTRLFMVFKQTEKRTQNIPILNPNRWYIINILPLVVGVTKCGSFAELSKKFL